MVISLKVSNFNFEYSAPAFDLVFAPDMILTILFCFATSFFKLQLSFASLQY